MSMLSKARKLSLVVSSPHILTCRSRYLFVLSHMRSRSTVLCHVLGSHPEIVGYSELHRRYTSRLDLLRMRADLYSEAKRNLSNKYLLDKILHNEIPIADELLDQLRPRIIISLREPEPTLKSIIQMGHRTGVSWYQDPQQAADYYCKRLEGLTEYARKMAETFFYLDADELVKDTEGVLCSLSKWLGLQSVLLSQYERFSNTGKRHHGDSSSNIRSGIIRQTAEHKSIQLPPAVLQTASESYHRCRSRILDYASGNAMARSA